MAFENTEIVKTREIVYALKYLGRDISKNTALEIIKEFKSTKMHDGVYYADAKEFVNFLDEYYEKQMKAYGLYEKPVPEVFNAIANWVEDNINLM